MTTLEQRVARVLADPRAAREVVTTAARLHALVSDDCVVLTRKTPDGDDALTVVRNQLAHTALALPTLDDLKRIESDVPGSPSPLAWAVHVDGGVPNREHATRWCAAAGNDELHAMGERLAAWFERHPDLDEPITSDALDACTLAADLLRAAPDELVTVVLWHADDHPSP